MNALIKKLRDTIGAGGPWPIALVLIFGLIAFVLIALFAPPDTQTALFGAHGLLFTIIGMFVRLAPPDDDRDSKP